SPGDITTLHAFPTRRSSDLRRERPRRCAAEQRDELAPLHSITSSARASNTTGISRPSVLAVLRLNAVWKCDGALMGTSPALLPLATWSTNAAMSRNTLTRLTP